ncbi:L,D-transpeptidase family protein [Sphaerimonospora sp. CA-214678]|uniref:L,D-transpeptidase family protein n=1 Tax=Sphaerimonospora sp. CA-214678 TaxID=3240029 RepID=UPI003D92D420
MGGPRRRFAAAALITAGAVTLATGGLAVPAQARTAPASHQSASHQSASRQASHEQTAQRQAVQRKPAPRKTLRPGAKGAEVTALQTRLTELGYVPGKIDGRYGQDTMMAVWAFQKVQGIKPTSTVASRTWVALENPKAPRALVPKGRQNRVEVNLTQQIMVLYRAGEPKVISHVSSGSGIPYVEYATWNGRRQRFSGSATTPTGDYRTTWRVSGWHRSYLGRLYNPIFFNGGIALHGALSVPLHPASHGCVRLPMPVAEILPGLLGTGVPVHVRGRFRR